MHDIPKTDAVSDLVVNPLAANGPGSGETPIALVVDASGIWPLHVDDQRLGSRFCWIDICGGGENERRALLERLELDEAAIGWALRFEQMGRMAISRDKLRAATWVADHAGTILELHLICGKRHIVTVWNGSPAVLRDVREHFAERIAAVENSPFQAAGMLLQLLLATFDHVLHDLDARLDGLRLRFEQGTLVDLPALVAQRQQLQSAWGNFDRYSSSVRSAVVGIEALAGMDPRGAEELNDYADRVEDIAQKLIERRRWMTEIIHDTSTTIAERQGEQINRLTLVSLIFLPVTAVTGFFGMNFNWMIDGLGSEEAFFTLGVVLPLLMMLVTVAWLARRGLIQLLPRPKRPGPAARGATTTAPNAPRKGA